MENKLLCLLLMAAMTFYDQAYAQERSTSSSGLTFRPRPRQTSPSTEELMTGEDEETQQKSQLTWTSWSEWSTCSSSTFTGFQIRNRVCPENARCPGDDIQLTECNEDVASGEPRRNQYSQIYTDRCNKLGDDMTLSCKLYLEKPDLAYDIFRKNSCFFTVNQGDDDLPGEDTTPLPLESMDNDRRDEEIFPVDSQGGNQLPNGDISSNSTNRRIDNGENEIHDAYRRHVIKVLIEERKCRARCDSTMQQAARLWALGTSFARSIQSTINILHRNGKLTTGIGVMFYEYNACISRCHSLGKTYAMFGGKSQLNGSSGNAPNLADLLRSLQQPPTPSTPQGNTESLCESTFSGCPPVPKSGTPARQRRRRQKRQISEEYDSPCFSSEDLISPREIKRKAGAELFYYESYVQKFTCRKCQGQKRSPELFFPKEDVRQRRNNKRAFCRQGFLKRFGLFIVDDPNGRYLFSTGERFSIEARSFEVESHCEIVILK